MRSRSPAFRKPGAAPAQRRRQRRLGVWALALFIVGIAAAAWGLLIEPAQLRTRSVEVASRTWPAALPPLQILAIADLHAGALHVDAAKLDQIVAKANALRPDVILLLGDFVIQHILFGRPMSPSEVARHLEPLRARFGVFAVLGNHDWYAGGEPVRQALQDVGIAVLENEAVPLPGSASRIWLAGIADDSTRNPDPVGTLASVPEDAAVVVFTHDPAIFPEVPARAALTLAGHTHGGQVVVPFWGALYIASRAPLRYARGLIHENGANLFVSSGVGTSVLPIRFGVPPEIVAITLRAAPH